MTNRESVPRFGPRPPTAAEVVEYLGCHSDFLAEHPDLLPLLIPPGLRSGDGVVDMHRYMLERLRGDHAKLQATQDELVQATRLNHSSQARIHAAVLALLAATTLEQLIDVVTTDLAVHLEVDAAVLGFEALERVPPGGNASSLKLLPKGAVERLMAGAKEVRLIADAPGDPLLFGGAASLVRAQGLVRLQLKREAPLGVLGLGARTPAKFQPGQGTELLTFLGRVVALSIRGWIEHG
ncbi:MAG: DUF484 family protein [Pseudomonadota bacterium]